MTNILCFIIQASTFTQIRRILTLKQLKSRGLGKRMSLRLEKTQCMHVRVCICVCARICACMHLHVCMKQQNSANQLTIPTPIKFMVLYCHHISRFQHIMLGCGNVFVNISKLIHIHPQHNKNTLKLKQMTATFFHVLIYLFHLLSNRLISFSGDHFFYFENYINIIC